jgi:hypothetical protein
MQKWFLQPYLDIRKFPALIQNMPTGEHSCLPRNNRAIVVKKAPGIVGIQIVDHR